MRLEEYCSSCDTAVVCEVNSHLFWKFKVGRIRCKVCGAAFVPCNECFGSELHSQCDLCPWREAEIASPKSERFVSKPTQTQKPHKKAIKQ